MNTSYSILLLIGLATLRGLCSDGAAAAIQQPVRVILVGDSTMAPHTGWGGAFCARHVSEMVACVNMARGGRSTATYRSEGHWALVLAELTVQGYSVNYVLIEMGHNDKSENPAVGTALKTEFPDNLRRFIDEVRALKGIPILVTPLASRHFRHNDLEDTLRPWAQEVAAVGKQMSVSVIDLNADSAKLFQQEGAIGSMSLSAVAPTEAELRSAAEGNTLPARIPPGSPVSFEQPASDPRRAYSQDYIHLGDKGADVIASVVARDVAIQIANLRGYVWP